MEFIGKAINGKQVLDAKQAQEEQDYLLSINDKVVIKEYRLFRPSRTNKQLGAWFGLFAHIVIEELTNMGHDRSFLLKWVNSTGNKIDKELLAKTMYEACPIYPDNYNPVTDKKPEPLRMSQMDIAQMAKFFDECRNWVAGQWGIHVPEPDANYKENNKDEQTKLFDEL
jgi:hypothetical protein